MRNKVCQVRVTYYVPWCKDGFFTGGHCTQTSWKARCHRIKIGGEVGDRAIFVTMRLKEAGSHAAVSLIHSLNTRFVRVWESKSGRLLQRLLQCDKCLVCLWSPNDTFVRSEWYRAPKGASRRAKSGMNVLRKEHVPMNDMSCFFVKGLGMLTIASTLLSDRDLPSLVTTWPRNVTVCWTNCSLLRLTSWPSRARCLSKAIVSVSHYSCVGLATSKSSTYCK